MASDVTHTVNEGIPFVLDGAPWIRVVPLRTPTLPPATHTNCYIVGRGDDVLVFDPASPYADEQARLDEYLSMHGLRPRVIVLTHHHVDHVSGATALAAKHGNIPIAAHAETAERLRGRVAVTQLLSDGEMLDGGLRALFTPGHAPGHLCFVDAAAHAIIAGDMVASVGTIIVEPSDGGDMSAYLASLRQLRGEVDRGATRLLPAHGPPIVDGGGRLDFYVVHRLQREERVAAALGDVPQTAEELVAPAYPDVAPALYALAARSLLAHLIKLSRDGRAHQDPSGRWRKA